MSSCRPGNDSATARPRHWLSPAGVGVLVAPFLVLLAARGGCAQSTAWSDRAFVNVNMTIPLTSHKFDDRLAPVIYAERAVVRTTHGADRPKPAIEPAAGVRLWRDFGVGGAISRRAVTEMPSVNALVPHPVLFNQLRTGSAVGSFARKETAIHGFGVLLLPLTDRLDVAVTAGPTFVRVHQDLLQGIDITESAAPFASVTIAKVAVVTRALQTVAINAGTDVTWFLKPNLGVGATARYVTGSASTRLSDGTPIELKVGGFEVGWGARLRLR